MATAELVNVGKTPDMHPDSDKQVLELPLLYQQSIHMQPDVCHLSEASISLLDTITSQIDSEFQFTYNRAIVSPSVRRLSLLHSHVLNVDLSGLDDNDDDSSDVEWLTSAILL